MSQVDPAASRNPAAGRFATTHWSLVLAAGHRSSPEAEQALTTLCELYWHPLYAFIRQQGYDVHTAQDLTQEFFARLLEKELLQQIDRGKGRFRSFVLAACKHFLANERDRTQALKRGGGYQRLPFDFDAAESRYGLHSSTDLTPEKHFDRIWAVTLLERVLGRLRADYEGGGKQKLFDHLKQFLTGEKRDSHAQVATALEMTEGSVKVAAHRLRRRYRELLRDEIAMTADGPEGIEEEIRDLFAALGA